MKLLQSKKVKNKISKEEKILPANSSGYTLLFAVLTAALVLGVAVFILGVSRKQLALAAAARDSMYSLYAADSGIECAAAAYWAGTLATTSAAQIPCAGMSPSATANWKNLNKDHGLGGWSTKDNLWQSDPPMYLGIDAKNGTCAKVVVLNGYNNTDGGSLVSIESRGYNYCDAANTPKASSRTVERAFRLTYQ